MSLYKPPVGDSELLSHFKQLIEFNLHQTFSSHLGLVERQSSISKDELVVTRKNLKMVNELDFIHLPEG